MTRTINFDCVLCLLMQFCFLTVAEAFYDNVNVKIRNGDEIIDLNWRRTEQYLANKNMPIWYAEKDKEPSSISHILAEIGDFITYHDVEKSSAVVFFTKYNFFYGVIDTRFYVVQLPLSDIGENIFHDVGGNYVIARETNENNQYFHDGQTDWLSNLFTGDQIELINFLIDSSNTQLNIETSSVPLYQHENDFHMSSLPAQDKPIGDLNNVQRDSAITGDRKSTILYPEVLVFITHEVYTTFSRIDINRGINLLVMYYIIHFNAIDMLFAKLATDRIAIHINIAGLVIEAEPRVFLYSVDRTVLNDKSVFYRFRDGIFLFRFPQYITQYQEVFPEDSFDFCFISTSYGMMRKGEKYNAKSRSAVNVYRQRYLQRPYENLLGLIVQSGSNFDDYVTATREIAQLMDIKHDLPNAGVHSNKKQCYAIMQKSESHCQNCLNWSEDSRDELKAYVKSNRNHCFLLNYPRSLYPYGQRIFSMNPEDQCMCYQFPIATLDISYMVSIPENGCDKQMTCSFVQNPEIRTPLPLDGTPCGGSNKVCWKKQCVEIGQ